MEKLSKKQKKLENSYFLNEFSMEFVGKNKMSPAEKRVMHARICMVCTIYAFYHCVNSFMINDISGARICFFFALYSGFLAKDRIEIRVWWTGNPEKSHFGRGGPVRMS